MFIYFQRERERERAQAGEGQRENPKQASAVSIEPDAGLEPMNCEVMT